MQQNVWQAPIPPPSILRDFDSVVPGSAERIVRAWELESEHRRSVEKAEQRSFYRDAMFGKIFAFMFVVMALGVAGYSAYIGAEWLGVVLGGGTIGAVVWAFVKTSRTK